jgi:hypothetical protein
LRGLFILVFFIPCCPPARAQDRLRQEEVAGSTVPAARPAAPAPSSLILNLSKNSADSRIGLDYSVKWDFSDLASSRPGLKAISSNVQSLSSWDITKNTRLNYYGFKINPWRLILADEKRDPGYVVAGATGPAGGGGVVSRAAPVSRKRLRLSVSPLIDDFTRNFDDNLRAILLRGSLRNSPQWQKIGEAGRREFVRDVLSLGIWDLPLPGVAESRAGLEYLAGKSTDKPGNKAYQSTGTLGGYRINRSTGSLPP